MKPPIHLVMNRVAIRESSPETALFRARGRERARERRRALLRRWLGFGRPAAAPTAPTAPTAPNALTAPARTGPAPAA